MTDSEPDVGIDHNTTVPENHSTGPREPNYCETCDKQLNPGWNYCPRCGREQRVNDWGDTIPR